MSTRRWCIALPCWLLLGTPALAGGAVDLTLDNNTSDDLSVTLVDLNAPPAQRVITHDVINGFAKLHLSVTPDTAGQGHISWTARTVGSGSQRRCGQHERSGLSAGATVHVYANRDCPSPIH